MLLLYEVSCTHSAMAELCASGLYNSEVVGWGVIGILRWEFTLKKRNENTVMLFYILHSIYILGLFRKKRKHFLDKKPLKLHQLLRPGLHSTFPPFRPGPLTVTTLFKISSHSDK